MDVCFLCSQGIRTCITDAGRSAFRGWLELIVILLYICHKANSSCVRKCLDLLLKARHYLRNRKHFPCFYRVIETRVEVWENEKCRGNTSRRRVFPQLFRVLPNLHECFCNSIEIRRKCFLFLLENSPRKITKNEENLIVLFIIKT